MPAFAVAMRAKESHVPFLLSLDRVELDLEYLSRSAEGSWLALC
jgi:hypothetical protein